MMNRSFFKNAMLFMAFVLFTGLSINPAYALVKLDNESINIAIKYGLQNQSLGLATILGPNWKEGEEGSLLNIYTPFMLVATQAAKKKSLPENPTKEEVKQCRRKISRIINRLTDPKEPQMVKFSIFMYGNGPDFARRTRARVVGVGRGQEVILQPTKKFVDEIADESQNNIGLFEGINSYYFKFTDIQPLDKYRLILTKPDGSELQFNVVNERIY